MTGYGRGEVVTDTERLLVEIRSVNNRNADLSVRMPRSFLAREMEIRERVGRRVSRGKVDLYVTHEDHRESTGRVHLDRGLAVGYLKALRELADLVGSAEGPGLSLVARYPDILRVGSEEAGEAGIEARLMEVVEQALASLDEMRVLEAERLCADIGSKLDRLEALREEIALRAPRVPEDYRDRLLARLEALLDDRTRPLYDPARVALEVALFADRAGVDEELVRLQSHLRQFRETLEGDGPAGKKLDFLIQELVREVNTIGSKANDLAVTQTVMEMKNEIERIREQVQNLE